MAGSKRDEKVPEPLMQVFRNGAGKMETPGAVGVERARVHVRFPEELLEFAESDGGNTALGGAELALADYEDKR
jgi:hypothetical protein